MNQLLHRLYGLTPLETEHSSVGAGSDTYFVRCREGKVVVKFPAGSEINHPEQEPALCEYLNSAGIPACRFLKNREGSYVSRDGCGRIFLVQEFIEGRGFGLNEAPDWLMTASADMLGRIHAALKDYHGLPTGIGTDFFRFMTPEHALASYEQSLHNALRRGDTDIAREIEYRIRLARHEPAWSPDMTRLTCQSTHGDYFISQLICGGSCIRAVIDWTTACVHPVVWELFRSFAYAAPSCRDGNVSLDELSRYTAAYLHHAPLTAYDLQCMAPLFRYQLLVCDYYGQHDASTAANRDIYLHQARFSTQLLRWLDGHGDEIAPRLSAG